MSGAQLQERLEEMYQHPEVQMQSPQDSPLLPVMYQQWVMDAPHTAAAKALLHTEYHTREKSATAHLSDW